MPEAVTTSEAQTFPADPRGAKVDFDLPSGWVRYRQGRPDNPTPDYLWGKGNPPVAWVRLQGEIVTAGMGHPIECRDQDPLKAIQAIEAKLATVAANVAKWGKPSS